jgi:hypothetical protein
MNPVPVSGPTDESALRSRSVAGSRAAALRWPQEAAGGIGELPGGIQANGRKMMLRADE